MSSLLEAGAAHPRGISEPSAIPLFAEWPAHSSVPLKSRIAVAQSGGQEWPEAGACTPLLTAVSTAAFLRFEGTASVHLCWPRRAAAALVTSVILAASILMCGGTGSSARAEHAVGAAIKESGTVSPYADYVAEASSRFTIPAAWIYAVMRVESANDPHARSRKGAIGLMQIMPKTWQELRTRHGLGADPYDPRDNILAGTAYLRALHDRFGFSGFLAAYNAGPERYADHLATGAPLPSETENYVAALASIIRGSQPERSVKGANNALAWRSASLFTAAIERRLSNPRAASSPVASSSRDAAIVDLSALVPPSNGLFIRRPHKDRVQ